MAADKAAMMLSGPAPPPHWLNAERVRVYSTLALIIFAITLAWWIAQSLPALVDPDGKPLGYDFMAYWSAARLALLGRPEAAFDESAIGALQHAAVRSLPNIVFPWHYPPTFLLPIAPLGLLPYPAALALFALATAALWAGFVRCILPDRRAWIVAAAAPAGLINLLDGQNAFLTASLAGFALLSLNRRPIGAGILIGLLAMKPQLAMLFPLALIAEARWRSIAAAAATVLAFGAASLAAFGAADWAAFLLHLPISQAMADAGAVPWSTMPTAHVFALSLGAPLGAAWALQAAVGLFAALCVWRAWRNRDAPCEAKAATLLAGSLLVSPYLFYYDLLWAALAVGWLALLGLRTGFARGEREILLFAWLVPLAMQPVQTLTSVQLGFPAVLLLLLAAARRAAPPIRIERLCAALLAHLAMWRDRAMSSPAMLPWVGIVAVIAFDIAMGCRLGWTVTNGTALAAPCAVLAGVALGYGLSGRSPTLASYAHWLLLWALFAVSGAVLSYVGAARDRPLWDSAFASFDAAIGFDWLSWFDVVHAHPLLQGVLTIGYASMMAQVMLTTLYFSWRGADHKNRELLLNAIVSLLFTIAVFSAFPALGPSSAVPALHHAYDSYLTELITLRQGGFVSVDLSHLKGIIVLPSFHTVMAILLTHIHRRSRLLVPALLTNGLMLLSIPIIGGHYVTDMIAGGALTVLAIAATEAVGHRRRPAAAAAI